MFLTFAYQGVLISYDYVERNTDPNLFIRTSKILKVVQMFTHALREHIAGEHTYILQCV